MKWPSFTILIIFAIILQVSLSDLIALGPQEIVPDFLILAGLLIAYRAGNDDDILMQCWLLGLAHDLSSTVPFGLYSTTLSLAALIIVSMRKWLNVRNMLVAILFTFFFTASIELLAIFITIIKGGQGEISFGETWRSVVFSAAYTAALAPYLQVFIKRPAWNLQNS